MQTYTFIIGSMDDFESMDDMLNYIENKPLVGIIKSNYSIYEFEAPITCDEETVTLIGRGIAFSAGWCLDGTLSCVITGPLDTQSEKDASNAGVAAREAQKQQHRSAVQSVDVWSPNDPVNW